MPRNYVTVRFDDDTRRTIDDRLDPGETPADWLRAVARERLAEGNGEREGGSETEGSQGDPGGDAAATDADDGGAAAPDGRDRRESDGYGRPVDYTAGDDGCGGDDGESGGYEFVDDCAI